MYGKMYNLPQGLVSLKQGKKFNDFQNDHLHIVGTKRLDLIKQTTSPNLGSIEPMTTNNSSNPIDIENEKIKESLAKLEKQFNDTLTKYTASYTNYLNSEKNQNRRYINADSTVYSTTSDNDVNCRKKCQDDENCEMYLMNDANDTCRLYKGVSNVIQHCQSGPQHTLWGQVKQNGAWQIPSDCDSGGSQMNTTETLNQELMNIAQQMYNEATKLEETSSGVEDQADNIKTELIAQIKSLNDEREQLVKLNTATNTLDAEMSRSEVDIDMNQIRYYAYGLSALALGAITFHVMTRK